MIKLLPKIFYDLSIENEPSAVVVIPDLMTRVRLKLSDADRKLMLSDYQMLDGESPEIVSMKLYGTMDYHWTIMFINERYDYISDFPLKYETIEAYCQKKYGAENVFNVHHYEDHNGNITEEYTFDWMNTSGAQPTGIPAEQYIWKEWYKYSNVGTDWVRLKTLQSRVITNFEYEDRLNESKRMIKVIKPNYIGQFVELYENILKAGQ